MKIYTSYFYQVRNFTPNVIPFSTAMWPPKYFGRIPFKDKRGIFNGLSCPPLVPGDECNNLCRGPENCATKDSSTCPFLKTYRAQLDRLDFDKVVTRLQAIANQIKEDEGFEEEPVVVLLVYEKPSNPCSERVAIQEWFRDNGIEVEEWSR